MVGMRGGLNEIPLGLPVPRQPQSASRAAPRPPTVGSAGTHAPRPERLHRRDGGRAQRLSPQQRLAVVRHDPRLGGLGGPGEQAEQAADPDEEYDQAANPQRVPPSASVPLHAGLYLRVHDASLHGPSPSSFAWLAVPPVPGRRPDPWGNRLTRPAAGGRV